MSIRFATRQRADDTSERDPRRPAGGRDHAPAPSAGLSLPAVSILGLQRSAGNAAVATLLQRPAARPLVQREDDDDETIGEGASGGESSEGGLAEVAGEQASAGEGGESGPSTEGEGPATDDGDGGDDDGGGGASGEGESADGGDDDSGENPDGYTPEQIERKLAEGDVTAEDPMVPMAGGAPPAAVSAGAGFHDGGRRAIVPFGSADPAVADADEATHPHAYTGGGGTGSVPWSGGGVGGGPKGNQGSGSLQGESVPKYDTRSNGPFSKADAWVVAGSGVADVHRDYVASTPGDQGNGWWISQLAASALEAHEQRHVASSRDLYGSTIQPVFDRIADSEAHGKGQMYWASDAITLLSRWIGWKDALESFKEQDAQWNAPQGEIDQRDYGTAGYPRNMHGPRTIGGKEYKSYLIMGSEPDPT